MKVFETVKGVRDYLDKSRQRGHSIGFVPTMGALHEGHLSLVRKANRENDLIVCSVFVNPKQFNDPADLKKYPRDLDKDLDILAKNNCDVVFVPPVDEMYPGPVDEGHHFGELEETMEGKYRKGHFHGVAVVVKRLFEIIEPARAYFGKKDYQQLLIVKKLVQKTGLPVDIVPCDTVREHDGLAMSSRNARLTGQERKDAAIIYKTLMKVRELYNNKIPVEEIKEIVEKEIDAKSTLKLEYFEIVDAENLKNISSYEPGQHVIACIAVFAGNTRLIDNMFLND